MRCSSNRNVRYYCLSATSALFRYIEETQKTMYAKASIKVVFSGSEKTAMIGELRRWTFSSGSFSSTTGVRARL